MAIDTASGATGRTGWHSGAAERQIREQYDPAAPSNDRSLPCSVEDLQTAADGECHFEIFRADQVRMTSTLFSGGDWRWRLVTTDGVILAEAAGYPNEVTCRGAVAVLQKRAASAPIITGKGESA